MQATHNPDGDEIRRVSVAEAVAAMRPGQAPEEIMFRSCEEIGRPAAEVARIAEEYLNNTPTPRLMGNGGGGGSSMGGGMGGGGSQGGIGRTGYTVTPGISAGSGASGP